MRGGPQLCELLHIWPPGLLPAALFVLAQLGSFDNQGGPSVREQVLSKQAAEIDHAGKLVSAAICAARSRSTYI